MKIRMIDEEQSLLKYQDVEQRLIMIQLNMHNQLHHHLISHILQDKDPIRIIFLWIELIS
jgi:hypothetical protein